MKLNKPLLFFVIFEILTFKSGVSLATRPVINDTIAPFGFFRSEINRGFQFSRTNSRETLKTDYTEYSEKKSNYNAKYFFSYNNWSFSELKHEEINGFFGFGPIYSNGTSSLKETIYDTNFKDNIYGVNLLGEVNYSGRFYSGGLSYGLVDVSGFGYFEQIQKNSEGTKTNLLSSAMPVVVSKNSPDSRFRGGIKARAGWGIGQPKVVNYMMEAEYILKKYYPAQLFSEAEIQKVASEVARLKNSRNPFTGHDSGKEAASLGQFINSRMLLTVPENLSDEWQYGELAPRFSGGRFDVGPFFKYYNIEPDFIYGGFVNYENNKYRNLQWNQYFKTELSYNRYKTRDWLMLETNLVFDYYMNLRSKISFGLKYIPILAINGFTHAESLDHIVVPAIEYYTELNTKLRMNIAFSYNITDDNDYYLKGPEFSLAIYRSRY